MEGKCETFLASYFARTSPSAKLEARGCYGSVVVMVYTVVVPYKTNDYLNNIKDVKKLLNGNNINNKNTERTLHT